MRRNRSCRHLLPALVAGLLMFVPLPSVIAQSPSPLASPAPNVGRPLTTAELDAVRVAISMTGDQAVVVADATVSTDPVVTDPACDATVTTCPYGRLLGMSTDDVVVVTARAGAVADVPAEITGPLVMSLVGSDVELLGVLTQTSGYTVPVSPEGFADQDALPIGTLIAVDGWLVVLGWGIPCPAPPGGLTDDSPFVRCPGGWITPAPDAPPGSATSIPTHPTGYGIPVQANAYDAFAPNPELPASGHATVPRQGVYLLRRVANPLPDSGEPFGWAVIARLDPIE